MHLVDSQPEPVIPVDTSPEDSSRFVESELRTLLVRVYKLIAVGLTVTAAVAWLLSRDASISEYISTHPFGFDVLFLFEIIVVSFISRAVDKLSLATTAALFFVYSIFNGFSFAVFFAWLPPASIAEGFAVAALTFATMAFYASRTDHDLSTLRSFFCMVAVGLVLMTIVNLALHNSVAYWATAYLAVMAFSGLACYHGQAIRDLEWEFEDDDADRCKAMYAGALTLYLDFVNIYVLIRRSSNLLLDDRDDARD